MTNSSAAGAVVFDLEFTAWADSMASGWLLPGQFKEIVQFGAVKVDGSFVEVARFEQLVRPRLNPVLSDYLVALTGIANERVRARGVDFVEAYRAFLAFAGDLPVIAFGRDDLVIDDNLRLYGIADLPRISRYFDARRWMAAQGFDMTGLHSCDLGPLAGVPFEGHKHDALCDAVSVAAGFRALMAGGAKPPVLP
ncbi:MAG: exonuclease domain-containing protein [Alphaproteobacteria bacterium]|nr:exonuclease domain-containing protein [Alphaproteobacteria bacterium]